jgi:hypothetical protein
MGWDIGKKPYAVVKIVQIAKNIWITRDGQLVVYQLLIHVIKRVEENLIGALENGIGVAVLGSVV